MRIILTVLLMSLYTWTSAQDVTEEICTWYEAGKYDQVISMYGEKPKSLSLKGLFHLGLSFYKKGMDRDAIEIMDMCFSKDPKDSGPLYIKGKSLNFLNQFGKAVNSFEKAIAVDGGNGSYFTGLGDSYLSMSQLDKALEAYQGASKHKDCPERAFQKIPLILSAMGKPKPALEAYYVAKDKVERGTEAYLNILFKIGLYESMNQDFFEAKIVLEELLHLDPTYYRGFPLLIQSYMGLRKFEMISPLREKLYTAHKQGLLKHSLQEKFCFDQFVWDDKLIVKAYERFESDKNSTYFKHIYEVHVNNIPSYSVLTKHISNGPKPYVLVLNKGERELAFAKKFDRKYQYPELKGAVIDVLSEKIQPIH